VKYAVKIVPKCSLGGVTTEQFEREVNLLLSLNHPGIVQVRDLREDSTYFYLVMELITGPNILSAAATPEIDTKPIFKQILDVVAYLHSQRVAHRDLKLDNILMDNKTRRIKLIDFGFSRMGGAGELFRTRCGSLYYSAPEVIAGQVYDGMAADMWSCGVILYCLVVGSFPWRSARNEQKTIADIGSGNFVMPEGVGKLCADLIRRLLVVEPEERLTAAQALGHPWLKDVAVSWGNDPRLVSQVSALALRRAFGPEQSVIPMRAQSFGPRMQRFAGLVSFRVNERASAQGPVRIEARPAEAVFKPVPRAPRLLD
jgi:serine/threonine protein kinase